MIDICDLIFITFDKRNSTMQKSSRCDKNALSYSIAKIRLHLIEKKWYCMQISLKSSFNHHLNDNLMIFVHSDMLFDALNKRKSMMQQRALCDNRALRYSIAKIWRHTKSWKFDIRICSLNRIVIRSTKKLVNETIDS